MQTIVALDSSHRRELQCQTGIQIGYMSLRMHSPGSRHRVSLPLYDGKKLPQISSRVTHGCAVGTVGPVPVSFNRDYLIGALSVGAQHPDASTAGEGKGALASE